MNKITGDHLQRQAFVYVRQSTMDQVQNNRESQRRQYDSPIERARWDGSKSRNIWAERIVLLCGDLGYAGSSGVHDCFAATTNLVRGSLALCQRGEQRQHPDLDFTF
jgi:hypothetical protein